MTEPQEKVVIEQTLLRVEEVFIYRIPPMRSADGHRAEDWNLAKPLATCKLQVLRRDNSLCINVMADRPKPGAPAGATETYLFAQSNVTVDFSKPSHRMDHWVMSVIDSSRYFALRISDAKTGREAFIGVGFRERTDATNFKMSLQDYENSLKREEKAAALQKQYEQQSNATTSGEVGGDVGSTGSSGDGSNSNASTNLPALLESKLSFKEGEKIHITLKNKGKKISSPKPFKRSISGSGSLKLPPPPGAIAPPPAAESKEKDVSTKVAQEKDTNNDSGGKDALNEDIEWGDFEG